MLEERPSAAGVAVEAISRDEATVAAATVPEEDREEKVEETTDLEAMLLETETWLNRQTRVILLLILLQFGLTLYLGGLSWWSITGVLWLVVGYGVWEQYSWSLALPLVLFTLDVALLLFGIGPRERAGFYAPASLDFLLILLRLGIWALIWRIRDELT